MGALCIFVILSFKIDKSYDLIPFNRKRYPFMDAFLNMLRFSDRSSINKELEENGIASQK